MNSIKKSFVFDESKIKYPYIISNLEEHLNLLSSLKPKPKNIYLYGYSGTPNEFTSVPNEYSKIFMVTVFIDKNNPELNKQILIST